MSSFRKPKSYLTSPAGVTLVEVMFSAGLIAVFLTGVCEMNWKSLALLRVNKQSASASLCVQQRAEQMRNLTWAQITDATYLRDNLLNADPGAASNVPGETETITMDSYPTASGTTNKISRLFGNAASIVSSNAALSSSSMVRVDFQISWTGGINGATHTRQFTTVIANGGITQ